MLDTLSVTYGENNTKVDTFIDVNGNNAFIMPEGNVTVTATFKAKQYTVKIHPDSYGTVTTDKTTVVYGDTFTLTVTPADGYELSNLDVSGGATFVSQTENQYTYTMSAGDVFVTPTFRQIVTEITTLSVKLNSTAATLSEGAAVYAGDRLLVSYGGDLQHHPLGVWGRDAF